jgi:HSP20 family protein
MTLLRYEPLAMINELHRDLDRLFETRRASGGEEVSAVADWIPPVDIREEDDRFVVRADVPGVNPDDIEITMEGGVLTISGTREAPEQAEDAQRFRRVERVSGRFHRRFTLPETADAEGVSARSSFGVLEVTIPKRSQVLPRRINVQAA